MALVFYKHIKMLQMFKKIQVKVRHFFKDRLWEIEADKLPFYQHYSINLLKIIILGFKGFEKDECSIRSSALTFFSLLSLVPVIAVAFAIAKGFGLEQLLEQEIKANLESQQEVMEYVLTFSKTMIESTQGGLLAVISIGFLLYTVIKLFNHIEDAVNTIWNIEKSRNFVRKFTDYLAIIIIAPLFLISAGTANVYISTIFDSLAKNSGIIEFFSPMIVFLIKTIPFLVIWILFALMYLIMPNKKVKFLHCIIAGIIAGTAYQIIQYYYINLQIGFSRYNAIYGSFAALPLFLIWMQLSWLVFLFGAEMASALESVRLFGYRKDYKLLSTSKKRILSILILKKIITKFSKGEDAPDIQQISNELKLPVIYIIHITDALIKAKLVVKVVLKNDLSYGFQPSKDIANIDLAQVIHRLDSTGYHKMDINEDPDFTVVNRLMEEYAEFTNQKYAKLLIKDI
jgi:membrane protein